MYHQGEARTARSLPEAPPGPAPEAAARLAVARVRKLLDAYSPGLPCDPSRLRAALAPTLADAAAESERTFALGWVCWLEGNFSQAETHLTEALRRFREQNTSEKIGEVAYWLARVRVRRDGATAPGEYESLLRTLGGSPRVTAWFVDLLWRAGRVDRAEQVWKSLRGNRRVAACPEGPLLEARVLLRRGEIGPAERVLNEASPSSGVVWVEKLLLLAWAAFTARQSDRGRELLAKARQGPYPAAALDAWEALCEGREGVEAPPALREYIRGQQARQAGDVATAAEVYRTALAEPAVRPFARYALAALGQEDSTAVLASQPGLFLAVRCRARLALERFRRRQATPAELLDALAPADAAGYRDSEAEHFRRLAQALNQRQPEVAAVRELAHCGCDGVRAALELAVRRLPPPEATALLSEWSSEDGPAVAAGLKPVVGRQLLRLLLLQRGAGGDQLAQMSDAAAIRLLKLAELLAHHPAEAGEPWRQEVRDLRGHDRYKGLAQALLLQDAAARHDADAVAALLDEADLWRRFQPGPPRWGLATLANAVAAQPTHPVWRRSLGRWLHLWAGLGSAGDALAAQAGLVPPRAATAVPPPGVPAVPWLLYQASRALGREEDAEALAFARRAAATDNDGPDTRLIRDTLPELERRVRARALGAILRHPQDGATPASLLADAVDLLDEIPQGQTLLEAATAGDGARAREALASLVEAADLPPRLAHHLALLQQRAALGREEAGEFAEAEPHWCGAWRCWLRSEIDPAGLSLVLDWLLTRHRQRISDLLARDAVEPARRLWKLVQSLPAMAPDCMGDRVERFRDELATEYLLTTREAMRYGAVPEGWRADYEKGLAGLRRLLSLDRDNVRLLTALVEICAEWFLDLYHQGDAAALHEQVERFTPFALQLTRLAEARPGDLAARAPLSEFCKFRGFLSRDREQKIALYREALRLNPANDNARSLLAEIEPPPATEEADRDGAEPL